MAEIYRLHARATAQAQGAQLDLSREYIARTFEEIYGGKEAIRQTEEDQAIKALRLEAERQGVRIRHITLDWSEK